MSKLFEKKNPEASVASVAYMMTTVAIIMIVSGLMQDSFNRHGVMVYSLAIAFTAVFAGAVVWQVAPFGSQKKNEPNED